MSKFLCLIFLVAQGLVHAALPVKVLPLVRGLNSPVDVEVAPGEPDSLYIVEQNGLVRLAKAGMLQPQSFLDIRDRVTSGGERGLLAIAFHPKYQTNKRYFVYYTGNDAAGKMHLYISEFRKGRPSETKILSILHDKHFNHNGGELAFGPDGMLYVGVGDGGGGGDPLLSGQDLNTLLGKILRIDIDKAPPYIPSDNPLVGKSGKGEIWAWGLRNPWRFSFDKATHALFAGDVGQHVLEEIDIIEKGKNYGWNVMEGTRCYPSGASCDPKKYAGPIFEYDHGEGISITGGYVYRGSAMNSLQGHYLYADYGNGKIWALNYDQKNKSVINNEILLNTERAVSSFGEEPSGEILVVYHDEGLVGRIVPK